MSEPQQRGQFWADVHLIADAVRRDASIAAALATGGSDGCAQCKGRTFAQRVEAAHIGCAEEFAVAEGAKRTAAGMSEAWIAISRRMDDPRFGQWIAQEATR